MNGSSLRAYLRAHLSGISTRNLAKASDRERYAGSLRALAPWASFTVPGSRTLPALSLRLAALFWHSGVAKETDGCCCTTGCDSARGARAFCREEMGHRALGHARNRARGPRQFHRQRLAAAHA